MMQFLEYQFTNLSLILSSITGGLLLFQILYYVIVYNRVAFYKNKPIDDDKITTNGISVIIIAQNDELNLQENLLQILEQEYPLFEVIVINENSNDDSEFVLHILTENYKNLKIINLQENINKFITRKFSLDIGIKSAKYDTIVITEPKCCPSSFSWLSHINEQMQNKKKKIAIGFCGIKPSKGFLNQFVQYDSVTNAMNCFSFALIGNPYTGVNENIAYSKDFFFRNGGLISQYRTHTGSNDIFVNRYANKSNTSVVLNKDSFTYCNSFSSYSFFKRNKINNYLAFKHFKFKDKFLLSLLPFDSLLLYLGIIFLIIIRFPWQYCIPVVVVKWLIQILYYKKCMKKFEIKNCYMLTPFMEVYFMFLHFNLFVKSLFIKKNKWE